MSYRDFQELRKLKWRKITGYTTVDISQWHRKEHFEAFQSVAQCTYNQTVQLDITAF
ncbi:hypothetical protein IE992_29505 [Klebsiella pneumoniae]|uniref:Chloramphenicol acetyltransferase n=1 Tax=Klebsiella pneumoniae TaxID=573 RepID=A0A927DYD3_KLEPN|nr:hypothetical protein [Klebsiella pneumoniae]MBF6067309.1 hypothetical protein [Klebsiella pneumoniae]MBF6067315.1 hypothetical protein [Klebsiella pneumoniae]QZY49649.1 hypothetical protein K7G95_01415 [Escherichia coli]